MSPDVLAGRYELTERIASGGMGQVWRGRDRVLERIVAIKTVDLTAQEPTARERFRREAIATAGLSAANIVQVYDGGVDNDTAYLVMELLTGPTLARVIHDEGPMGIEEGLKVALEVARALLTAHKVGIVHRDIKPGNVMYHHDQIKLVDFGIAQFARHLGAALTAPATALGTAAYMSPEQATGEGATDKSDWYALGCLMTTIFTGLPPFKGEALAVANQQINAKPPYLSERRPEVPLALDRLVANLLAKEPGDRPTGEQVVEQLAQLTREAQSGTTGDPNASTILLAGAAGAGGVPDATALYADGGWAENGQTAEQRRASYRESPWEAPAQSAQARPPVRPVPPPPPIAPEPRERRPRKSRGQAPVGLIITVILLLLAVGVAGAFLVMDNRRDPGGPVEATPTPSPVATTQPTTTRPPTTRVPTTTPTMRRTTPPPATTEPPTMEPTTTEPTTTAPPEGNNGNGGDSGGGNEGSGGNGNQEGEADVQNAIRNLSNRVARDTLSAAWDHAKRFDDLKSFEKLTERMEESGLLSKGESKAVTKAAEKALDD